MSYFHKFRKECEAFCGAPVATPPKEIDADLALPCFHAKNPVDEAKKLAGKKLPVNSLIGEVRACGPYLNFYIDKSKFSKLVVKEITVKNSSYGKGKKKGKILLEHTSVNPSGPIHVGRLRNAVIGDTLARILRFNGFSVETHFYVNDLGKQIAMIAWGMKNKLKPDQNLEKQYKAYLKKPDFKTMLTYVAAYNSVTGSEDKMKEVEAILEKSEKGDKKSLAELRKIAEQCLEGQKQALKRLGITFDAFDFESSFLAGTEHVLKKLKPFLKEEGGAVCIDLSRFGLERRQGPLVLKRSNGTTVYILRDLAYHLEKVKMAGHLINVLGEDHKTEFQELHTMLTKLLGVKNRIDAVHYAFVSFEGGKLSTRKGNIAPLDALIDEGIEKSGKSNAPEIVKAAIRYHLIKNDLQKQVKFVWEDALNFEGNTGPYLQYTHARAMSILRKAASKPVPGALGIEELAVIKKLSQFPDVVEKSGSELKPHYVAAYLYELAALFNEYYHAQRVIGSEKEQERLALVAAVAYVMKNGLELLGISALEKM